MKVFRLILTIILIGFVNSSPLGIQERLVGKHDGYCRVKDVYIKEGEESAGPLGQCVKLRCISAEPKQVIMLGVGCPKFKHREECVVSNFNLRKRYPACCPHDVCPGDGMEERGEEGLA